MLATLVTALCSTKEGQGASDLSGRGRSRSGCVKGKLASTGGLWSPNRRVFRTDCPRLTAEAQARWQHEEQRPPGMPGQLPSNTSRSPRPECSCARQAFQGTRSHTSWRALEIARGKEETDAHRRTSTDDRRLALFAVTGRHRRRRAGAAFAAFIVVAAIVHVPSQASPPSPPPSPMPSPSLPPPPPALSPPSRMSSPLRCCRLCCRSCCRRCRRHGRRCRRCRRHRGIEATRSRGSNAA